MAEDSFDIIFNEEIDEKKTHGKKKKKEEKINSLKGKKKITLKNIDLNSINERYVKPDLTSKYQSSLAKDNDIKHLTSKLNKLQLSDFVAQPNEKLQIDIVKKNLYYSTGKYIPGTTECWNCNTSKFLNFSGIVLQLPYKFHPSVLEISGVIPGTEQVYKSSKNLTIKGRIDWENRNKKKEKKEGKKEGKEEKLIKKEYFDSEGFFCRPGCLLRYYYEHRNESLYRNSLSLIRMMFKMLNMDQGKNYRSFPSAKMLIRRGGVLSDDEYYKTTTDDVNVKFIDTKQFVKDREENKEIVKSSQIIFEQVKMK